MNKKKIDELQKKMTYNENGEGVINGKTIRELEAENAKNILENQLNNDDVFEFLLKDTLKKRYNKLKHRMSKGALLLKNNIEIIIGIGISLLFVFVYYLFKTNDENSNASLLSGLIGGLGAVVAIILSISFSKRSNEQSLDSSVLPYIIVKKQ